MKLGLKCFLLHLGIHFMFAFYTAVLMFVVGVLFTRYSFKALFSFFTVTFAVGCFVISGSVFVSNWGDKCLCADDYWEEVKA